MLTPPPLAGQRIGWTGQGYPALHCTDMKPNRGNRSDFDTAWGFNIKKRWEPHTFRHLSVDLIFHGRAAALSVLTTVFLKNVSKTLGHLTSRRNHLTFEGAGRGMLVYIDVFVKISLLFKYQVKENYSSSACVPQWICQQFAVESWLTQSIYTLQTPLSNIINHLPASAFPASQN